MVQLIIAIALLAHGVGHALFLANSWGYWKDDVARPALFENVLHVSQAAEGIAGIIWLIPLIGFSIAAWGFYSDTSWWRLTALAAAVLSAVLIVVWWGGLTTSSEFFALVFDIAVAVVMIWQLTHGAVTQ